MKWLCAIFLPLIICTDLFSLSALICSHYLRTDLFRRQFYWSWSIWPMRTLLQRRCVLLFFLLMFLMFLLFCFFFAHHKAHAHAHTPLYTTRMHTQHTCTHVHNAHALTHALIHMHTHAHFFQVRTTLVVADFSSAHLYSPLFYIDDCFSFFLFSIRIKKSLKFAGTYLMRQAKVCVCSVPLLIVFPLVVWSTLAQIHMYISNSSARKWYDSHLHKYTFTYQTHQPVSGMKHACTNTHVHIKLISP